MPSTAFKKKLYQCRPSQEPAATIKAQISRRQTRAEPCDPASIERGVRQRLADKVSGNLAGVWLLVAEHLRLGTWDLLCGWTRKTTERAEPRLAMQLVHEAALCTAGIRAERSLCGRGGFELANGLPFIANDVAVHSLLSEYTIAETMQLQAALGKLRRASGHFSGKLLAIDPHRTQSHSRRQMRQRVEKTGHKPVKMNQTFWVLDADTCQPVCFTTATASRSVVDATPELVDLAAQILAPAAGTSLILVDAEHFSVELLHDIQQRSGFDMLVPVPNQPAHRRRWKAIPDDQFTRRWAGFATTKAPYEARHRRAGSFVEFIERSGERPEDWRHKGFVCTADRDEVATLTGDYPHRWHIEEFFNANQSLGWHRAGTMNLNIRYAQMTMALIAQAVIHQVRQRLGEPFSKWDADHLSRDIFSRLDGDVRVTDDTIIVTYYNAPNADLLRPHYQGLPDTLAAGGITPHVPWLYNYKLDFRFR